MKILVSGMSGNRGGIESCIMNYVRNINHRKIQFDFLCYGKNLAYENEIIDRGGKIYHLPRRRKFISYYQKIVSIFYENKYDALWNNTCELGRGCVLLFKIAYEYGVPLRILHAHSTGIMSMSPLHNNRIFHEMNKICIEKYLTDYWACSKAAGSFFYRKKIVQSPKYKIINNAIDSTSFRFDRALRDKTRKILGLDNKLVIGHVGLFHPAKNHEFLLRVFHEVCKKEPNTVLLLVGDGKLRPKIEVIVRMLNLAENVHFLGIRSDIPELLNAIDVFVFPSNFEGLPVILIETQAASLYNFASTNVSSATKITDHLSFVDLKKSPAEWADLILSKKYYRRSDMVEEIRKAGYDIKKEAVKLEQFFLTN